MVWSVLFPVLHAIAVWGQETNGYGPPYDQAIRPCKLDEDCKAGLGESCIYLYQGCSLGQCMCDPSKQRPDSTLTCRNVKRGGQHCRPNDLCPEGMTCRHGFCTCYLGEMMKDGLYCRRAAERLLGQRCTPSVHICIQRASDGYTTSEVTCSKQKGYCECEVGYKKEGNSCVRWNLGEWGCRENYQCKGGAMCRVGRCVCPSERLPTAGATKCARVGAITNLPLGSTCSEINERRYCASGLVCHQCGVGASNKCVKSRVASDIGYLVGGSSPVLHSSPSSSPHILAAAILAAICILVQCALAS